MSLTSVVARSLEAGRGGAWSAAVADVWGAVASKRLCRPLVWKDEGRVIAVGGLTLGGSGKTPLAVACVRWLKASGESVALVGHAYRANPGVSRIVRVDDAVGTVGDEALDAARALASLGVPVVVAPTRQRALDLGLAIARIAVVDGALQCSPRRASLSLLAVDGHRPWGSGRCPPSGDLRAPAPALFDACDRVVGIGVPALCDTGRPVDIAVGRADSLTSAGAVLGWGDVRNLRVGLWTGLARPDRVVRLLAQRGVVPHVVVGLRDHGAGSQRIQGAAIQQGHRERIDLWLCTSKCATQLSALSGGTLGSIPVATIDYVLDLPDTLRQALMDAVA